MDRGGSDKWTDSGISCTSQRPDMDRVAGTVEEASAAVAEISDVE